MNIGEIKSIFKTIQEDDRDGLEKFAAEFGADTRSGVIAVVNAAKKKIEAYDNELLRTDKLYAFEKKYAAMGMKYICGIDEVGRGPLAGPVVTCAVILPQDEKILYLNDSKQLSARKREELYDVITSRAVSYGIGISSETRIDEINILQATYEAMRMSIGNLKVKPDILLNDAVKIPNVNITQVPIIKGDTLSASIAAASIVAKVTRDRMMAEYDKLYPGYDFGSNMGYGSPKHIAAIKSMGLCEIHRRSFTGNFVDL
ncbi:MAG: ribonuclease HII [Clostridium sp.]|nr:ribonuclease HII [Clostridium sp.]MCM1400171.1 ribonuclease HII [Clostridium sp.]MCM1460903.1 ribonuclease HII [Bacteroides sp.]